MGQSLKSEAGASIIEICITLVIITVTTMLIMSFSRSTCRMSADARYNDAAYLAAEEKLADLTTKVVFDAPFSDNVTIDNTLFQRSWTIDNVNTITRAVVTVTNPKTNKTITLSGAIN